MKNLSELNLKWYWRLIKVFYVLFFGIILLGGIILIFDSYWKKEINVNKSKVICYSPDDRQFLFPEKHKVFSLKDIGINKLESNYSLKTNGFNYENFITNYSYNSLQITIYCINDINKTNKDYKKNDIKKYDISGIDMFLHQKSYELRFGKNKIISDKGGINYKPTKEEEAIFVNQMRGYIDYVNNSYSDYDRSSKLDFSIKMFDLKIYYLYQDFILYLILFIFGVYLAFEVIRRISYYIILGKFFPKESE